MALINCPECGREVSSAAESCPACGHPILQASATAPDSVAVAPSSQVLPPRPEPRSLSFGLTGTVAGLLWAAAVGWAIAAVAQFAYFGTWLGWRDGEFSLGDVAAAEEAAGAFTGLALFGFLAVSILFIVWFWQAYRSAASRGASGMKWGPGWTIGSWFIPFANWVIPKLVMNEVDRMSNPMSGEPPINVRWRRMPRLVVSDVWWIVFLVGFAFQIADYVVYEASEVPLSATLSEDRVGAWILIAAAWFGLWAISGVFLGVTTMRIGKRLRTPHV